MNAKLKIETEMDSLCLVGDKIHAVVNSIEYVYGLPSVKKIVLLTTDLGPMHDDMALVIDVGNNDVIYIMSEHKCFTPFLFDQIGKALPVDYQKIISLLLFIRIIIK